MPPRVPTTAEIVLTEEQEAAASVILSLVSQKQVSVLSGFAGTGKSTVVKHLTTKLPQYRVCAYTGKAADVLRRKGVRGSSTIHSLIYDRVEIEDLFPDSTGVLKWEKRVVWQLKPPRAVPGNGFIVDEGSMVGRELFNDLKSYNRPIIVVGDHGQLQPVGEDVFSLMLNPDVALETVHRNAGEIARFAEFLRKGGDSCNWAEECRVVGGGSEDHSTISNEDDLHGRVQIMNSLEDSSGYEGGDPDVIICAFNTTRVMFNTIIREQRGYPHECPTVGDRVICLHNAKDRGLFNGMQGYIARIDTSRQTLTFVPLALGDPIQGVEENSYGTAPSTEPPAGTGPSGGVGTGGYGTGGLHALGTHVRYDPEAFNNPASSQTKKWERDRVPFDYAYCLTCHKMQGDEADRVLVLEQKCRGWEHHRWAYTAASRARKRLIWVPHRYSSRFRM